MTELHSAHADQIFDEHGIPAYEMNIATVKKQFAGHGRAEKSDMMARCAQLG